MEDVVTISICIILVLGILSQWFAWWVKMPAILFLLGVGLLLGPGLHIINPDAVFGNNLFPIISMAVALIVFEGSLSLRLNELGTMGPIIRNLVTIGYITTVVATTVLAHIIFHLPWQLSLLFGAITSIGGPTVVAPILRSIRLSSRLHKILHWESILIDPIGALVSVLIFGLVTTTIHDSSFSKEFIHFISVIVVGSALGIGCGFGLGTALKRQWIPEYLINISTLTFVVLVYSISDTIDSGGGLLAASLMGITLANMPEVHIKDILNFKENLSVLIISVLFIVLAARIHFPAEHKWMLTSFYLFLFIQFIFRPLSVWLSTYKSDLIWQEKIMLAWICPRGIVTAAVASLFSISLMHDGFTQVEPFVLLTFMVIMSIVVFESLTAKLAAKIFKQHIPDAHGIILVGANPFSLALAKACEALQIKILLVDTHWRMLANARVDGIETYYGDALTADTTDHIITGSYNYLFALTSNHEFNVLCCLHYKPEFSRRHVSTLMSEKVKESQLNTKNNIKTHRRLFSPSPGYSELNQLITAGAQIKATEITEQFNFKEYSSSAEMIYLFAVSASGNILPFTNHDEPKIIKGTTVISLVIPKVPT